MNIARFEGIEENGKRYLILLFSQTSQHRMTTALN